MPRVFLFLLLIVINISFLGYAQALPNTDTLTVQLEQAEKQSAKELIDVYQTSLKLANEYKDVESNILIYQNIIDNFTSLSDEIKSEIKSITPRNTEELNALSVSQLELENTSISKQLSLVSQQIKQLDTEKTKIIDSLNELPQKQAELKKMLTENEAKQSQFKEGNSDIAKGKKEQLELEIALNKSKKYLLTLEQNSASKRQELSRLQSEFSQLQYNSLIEYQQVLQNQLTTKRQSEIQQALESSALSTQNLSHLPKIIVTVAEENKTYSQAIAQQANRLNQVTDQQPSVFAQIESVRQAQSNLETQAKWLKMSTGLGEALRIQLSRIPEKPKPQQLDKEMADIRLQRLYYNEELDNLDQKEIRLLDTSDEKITTEQQQLLSQYIQTQRELLISLVSNCDSLVLELTKLKVANSQLIDVLDDITAEAHRYFFWIADVNPISLDYLVDVVKDVKRVVSLNTFSEIANASLFVLQTSTTLLIFIAAILFTIFGLRMKKSFEDFLTRAAQKIGKVTQDSFLLTFKTLCFSLLIALPIPILWAAVGYTLKVAWDYPAAVSLGSGMNAAAPILWVFMITATFSHSKGLFIAHFNWSPIYVARAMKYYRLSVCVIIPLVILLIAFNTFNNREFYSTLGRLCFVLLCIALILVMRSLHKANVPLYLDKKGSGDNIFNTILWVILRIAPWLAAIASCVGYLSTSLALLGRLQASVAIWFGLLLVYYVIRRWMFIQRRRIEFERAKQRRAERLVQRQKNSEDNKDSASNENNDIIEEPIINLDVISAQSLLLIRSILSLIALVTVILLWSELHSAFSFLDNIKLWNSNTVIAGAEQTESITLASLLICILILIITAQLVKNLPALLELGILQHLDLTPGTGYAISTITKYVVSMIGVLVGASFLGIDWSKLQWLVAALGFGIGFGLQEIFANFISGLIILFEKPIRIGDTVTIRELTGTITKINTRATTIVDWDRKEIIMPNKAFVTEQLINWSLSDAVTRIVITVPATVNADSQLVEEILQTAAARCTYVLDDPKPEAFLVDIQEGIQIFELRVFAAEMGHRMPLRNELHQLILMGYKAHNLQLPFPPFQASIGSMGRKSTSTRRIFSEGSL